MRKMTRLLSEKATGRRHLCNKKMFNQLSVEDGDVGFYVSVNESPDVDFTADRLLDHQVTDNFYFPRNERNIKVLHLSQTMNVQNNGVGFPCAGGDLN